MPRRERFLNRLHRYGTKTEHGFASLFQNPGGGFGVVWLDGRGMPPPTGHDDHVASGAMSVRFATFDRAWKQTSETWHGERT